MSENSKKSPYEILASQVRELGGSLKKLRSNYDEFSTSFEGERIEKINSQVQELDYAIKNSKEKS